MKEIKVLIQPAHLARVRAAFRKIADFSRHDRAARADIRLPPGHADRLGHQERADRRLRESAHRDRVPRAVIEGFTHRFRPVMMTASVVILALIPMLFSTGPGSEVTRPLAVEVIGGLFSCTALTLLVVPVLYRWFEEKQAKEA